MSYHFREFDDERQWLRRSPRHRHQFLLGLLLVPLTLVWLPLGGASEVGTPPSHLPAPAAPTAEQQALEAGRRALEAWGRFAVTNHLGTLHGWFWTNGPQFQKLARDAKLRRGTKVLGPPAYRFTLIRVRVLAPSPRHRILRAQVRVTRPGERRQSNRWDVEMRRSASGDRWRLWSVNPTHRPRARSPAESPSP